MKETITFDSIIKAIPQLAWKQKIQLQKILHQEITKIELEETEEIITVEEIMASEEAWQNYLSGKDKGISSQELKQKY